MDVDSDFFEPPYESMEINSAQPNIVAGPSQTTALLLNKRLAWYVIQHPNYLQRELEQKGNAENALGKNVKRVGQRDTAKTGWQSSGVCSCYYIIAGSYVLM